MHFKNEIEFIEKNSNRKEKKLKDSLQIMTSRWLEASYFSLEKNENAQNYFNPDTATKTILIEKLIPVVTEKLLDFNANPKGNPYAGQEKIEDKIFIINKIKILNHRWIIAEFSNGEYWGEALIKYFINEDESVSYETFETFLYPK